VPQMVADSKTAGTFDYIWSLPVYRMVYVAADATIYILISIPGVILSLILARLIIISACISVRWWFRRYC